MFTSTHYGGKDINTQYRKEEQWKKVFGPVFIYLNSNRANGAYKTLWKDAKRQVYLSNSFFLPIWITFCGIWGFSISFKLN